METEHNYQIGTVSALTGLDPHTIRAWERRYGAITPSRTDSGRRRYDAHTVERLQLLKALVDSSESIGKVANLPDEVLRERLEKLADLGRHRPRRQTDASAAGQPWTLGLMAPGLEAQLRANSVAFPEIELAVAAAERQALLDAVRRKPCEIVVLDLDALGSSALGFVQACRSLPGAPLVVVLYQFAQRDALARLAQSGAKLVQTPIRLEQLRRALLDLLMIENVRTRHRPEDALPVREGDDAVFEGGAVARRFDDDQLAKLFEVTTGIECECPNHLSSLVSGLVAFERYSRSCEVRDEADARLHRRLADGTSEARVRLESLLALVCEQEGITI